MRVETVTGRLWKAETDHFFSKKKSVGLLLFLEAETSDFEERCLIFKPDVMGEGLQFFCG